MQTWGNEKMQEDKFARTPENSLYPLARTQQELKDNIESIKSRISAACQRSGRDPAEVRLLPISKTVDVERLRAAYACGCRVFGENKVQEAAKKYEEMSDLPDLQWAITGHLQTNKARVVAGFATEFQALDSLRVAEELDARLQAQGRGMDVLIEVNTSGESSKFGLHPDEVGAFIRKMPVFSSLRVRGFMTLALFSDDITRVRQCFVLLRSLRDRLRQYAPQGVELDQLSMGMSGDFETAIEEGATTVRIGQAIFGSRL